MCTKEFKCYLKNIFQQELLSCGSSKIITHSPSSTLFCSLVKDSDIKTDHLQYVAGRGIYVGLGRSNNERKGKEVKDVK